MKNVAKYTLLFAFVITSCLSQNREKKAFKINTIAFYNLENLFDTIDDPNTKDEYSPILKLKGNKSNAYWGKINNMARVLSEIGKEKTGNSPEIIGVSEIENSGVLDDLLNSDFLKNIGYDYIHVDSPDWRGIDVALLYRNDAFSPSDYKVYELKAWNDKGYRVKTRNQLLVSGYLDKELIHLIINHWPSQRGGTKKTDYLRIKSAELTSKIISELRNIDSATKIITLGDFNDNPNSTSIKKGLLTVGKKKNASFENNYNPFENIFNRGFGSLIFRDNVNLFDQIIFSSTLLAEDNDYTSYKFFKAGIYRPKYLINNKGKFKGYPYRSWSSNNTFSGGYSDHFPVYIYLIKEK